MNPKTGIWNLTPVLFAICVTVTGTAHAQQRPLVTEDPETIGTGRVLLEGGFSIDYDQPNYVNGLEGDITRFGSFGSRTPRSRTPPCFFPVTRPRASRT
jgi:hypothetical protein